MQKTKNVAGRIVLALLLAGCSGLAQAQTTPTGQPVTPGTRNNRTSTACTGTDAVPGATSTTDTNCEPAGPGFVAPTTNMPMGDRGHQVTSIVRVDALVPKPPVTMPEGDTFSVVGNVTLLKLHRPALEACLASGKRISERASAGTSTTCLDHKGEVIAYQECKAGSCTVVTPQDMAKQQETPKRP